MHDFANDNETRMDDDAPDAALAALHEDVKLKYKLKTDMVSVPKPEFATVLLIPTT
jgi:hypothetical protein